MSTVGVTNTCFVRRGQQWQKCFLCFLFSVFSFSFSPFSFLLKVIYFGRNGTMLHFALYIGRCFWRLAFTGNTFCGIFSTSNVLVPQAFAWMVHLRTWLCIKIDFIMTSAKSHKFQVIDMAQQFSSLVFN